MSRKSVAIRWPQRQALAAEAIATELNVRGGASTAFNSETTRMPLSAVCCGSSAEDA